MTKIIAEIGWNHMGDLHRAYDMIQAASDHGADFVKFQTWSVDRLKSGPWDEDGRREIYEGAELSLKEHKFLNKYAERCNVKFFTSVFSIEDAELLNSVQSDYVKIPSMESRNLELIDYCDRNFSNIFLSTGTSTFDEIKKSVGMINNAELTLFHCVSSYPCDYKNANLERIRHLNKLCKRVGYSDHTLGVLASFVSLEYGVDYIEKHFTTSNELPGRDNKFAIVPDELREIKNYINFCKVVKEDKGTDYQECELETRKLYTGRFDG